MEALLLSCSLYGQEDLHSVLWSEITKTLDGWNETEKLLCTMKYLVILIMK